MTSMSTFLKTFNAPWPVRFAGFESNTAILQSQGWDLSAEQMIDRAAIRLALRHEAAGLYAVSAPVDYRYFVRLDDLKAGISNRTVQPFQIVCMGSGIRFRILPEFRALSFQAVSGIPEAEMSTEISIEDAIPFRKLSMDAPEIIMDPKRVPELMDIILKLQDPRQVEIREKRRREAYRSRDGEKIPDNMRPISDIRAQIITLAG